MNYDKIEKKNTVANFSGELKKNYPRVSFNTKIINELIAKKIMLNQTWVIKMEVPLDMALSCDRAMGWIQNRVHKLVAKDFLHIGTEAAIKETTIEGKKCDQPFWFIHVIHPEYKNPINALDECVEYAQNM